MEQREMHVKLKAKGYDDRGSEWDDGAHPKIEKIIVGTRGSVISSIRCVYLHRTGAIVVGPEHGGKSSKSIKEITVKNGISRIVGSRGYSTAGYVYGVTFLEFFDMAGASYGSFGERSDDDVDCFTFESDAGFTGLHGRATGMHISSLGVYISASAPATTPNPPQTDNTTTSGSSGDGVNSSSGGDRGDDGASSSSSGCDGISTNTNSNNNNENNEKKNGKKPID